MQNNPTWNTITEGDSTKSVVYLNKNDKSYLQLPKGVVSELTDNIPSLHGVLGFLISGKNVGWPIDRSAREIHPCGDQEREQRDHEEKQ